MNVVHIVGSYVRRNYFQEKKGGGNISKHDSDDDDDADNYNDDVDELVWKQYLRGNT